MYHIKNPNNKDDGNGSEDDNEIRHHHYGEATAIVLLHDEM